MTRPFLLPLSFMASRVGAITVAACTIALSLMFLSEARAATLAVTNCNDSGAGSLRTAVATATSGDTVDLRRVTCRRILLTSGQIFVKQANLNLLGPGRTALTVDGNQRKRVFWHLGTGTLALTALSVANGHVSIGTEANGGCIRSEGTVRLQHARVHHCSAVAHDLFVPSAHGGAIYAADNILLYDTSVFSSYASGYADGGGLYAVGDVRASDSRVFGNSLGGFPQRGGGMMARGIVTLLRTDVSRNQGGLGGGILSESGVRIISSYIHDNIGSSEGGGVYVSGRAPVIINKSTIANNRAQSSGGLSLGGLNVPKMIMSSTISGNAAENVSGAGIAGDTQVLNSTIAFNRESPNPDTFPGQCLGAINVHGQLHIESSIVAMNGCSLTPGVGVGGNPAFGDSVIGADNLIGASNLPLPSDTISVNPRLSALANNGGSAPTHALLADSPAIDQGNNVAGFRYDQRGVGFPRVKGASADIGAYER